MDEEITGAPANEPLAKAAIYGTKKNWVSLTYFVIVFLAYLSVTNRMMSTRFEIVSLYVSLVWTAIVPFGLVALTGFASTVLLQRHRRKEVHLGKPTDQHLDIVIPTIGHRASFDRLRQVVLSFARHVPSQAPNHKLLVVTEEDAEARLAIEDLCRSLPQTECLIVPGAWNTANGTRHKARANAYAAHRRMVEGRVVDTGWVLHMDDDTACDAMTVTEVVQVMEANRDPASGIHLAQGVLSYFRPRRPDRPRFKQLLAHWKRVLLWEADAVRPAHDLGDFAFFTGLVGRPVAGFHGELMLVRSTVEQEIGWDFGPNEIVEDARFALEATARYPHRISAFHLGRSIGSSPLTIKDFFRQRRRWAEGMCALVANSEVDRKARAWLQLKIAYAAQSLFQHIIIVLPLALLIFRQWTTPLTPYLLPIWALGFSYVAWMYMAGYLVNLETSSVSGLRRVLMVIGFGLRLPILMPMFTFLESTSALAGATRWMRRAYSAWFTHKAANPSILSKSMAFTRPMVGDTEPVFECIEKATAS